MITVIITPNETWIYKIIEKRNKLQIIDSRHAKSYYENIKQQNGNLEDLFLSVKALGNDDVYIILPDNLFDFIDVKEYSLLENISDKNKETWLKEQYNIEINQYYYSSPFFYHMKARKTLSSYFIKREYCQVLLEAANKINVLITSISAISFAYLTVLGEWEREHILIEDCDTNTVLVSYNPLGGIFKNSFDKDNINSSLSQYDYIAKEKFKKLNMEVPIMVLPLGKESVDFIPENRKRNVVFDIFPNENIYAQIAAAPLLINLSDNKCFYSKSKVERFLSITEYNVLPKEVKHSIKQIRIKNLVKKYTKIGSFVMMLFLLVEIIGTFYFNSITIPGTLQNKYNHAEINNKIIKKEVTLINTAKEENEKIYEILNGIVSVKPQNLGFGFIEIGTNSNNKPNEKKWIQFIAQTPEEPIVLRDFADTLIENNMFRNIILESINTSNNMKTGKFIISKGTAKEHEIRENKRK